MISVTEERGTSIAKIRANRQNARKSTGPQTLVGKQKASRNSFKHGLLSQAIVIDAGGGTESREEYDALLDQLHDDLHPRGALEAMLVERIAVCYWRLRRAIRAESGETRKGLYHALAERFAGMDTLRTGDSEIQRLKTIREEILSTGSTGTSFPFFKDSTDCSSPYEISTLEALVNLNHARGEKKAAARQVALEKVDDLLERFDATQRLVKAIHNGHQDAIEASRYLVPSDAMDRILRYETTIERQLYKAIHELERLQQRRLGEVLTVFVFQWLQASFCETKPIPLTT